MKLSYSTMRDLVVDDLENNRVSVFTQLRFDRTGARRLPQKLNHALIKNSRKIKAELEDYDKAREDALLQFAKTNKKGELLPGKDDQAQFVTKKAEKGYEEAVEALLKTKVDVDIMTVTEQTISLMDSQGGMENHLYEALAEFMIEGLQPEEEDDEDTEEEADAEEESK